MAGVVWGIRGWISSSGDVVGDERCGLAGYWVKIPIRGMVLTSFGGMVLRKRKGGRRRCGAASRVAGL